MPEIINAYNNSWPFVQIVMLATLLGLFTLPIWLTHRWLSLRKKLPDNIVLALAQEGDVMTLTVRKGAPITPTQLTNLLAEPTSKTDIHTESVRDD
ncbi:MAG: hypothetical protein EBT87_07710 [Alphaproteobacteria bacterium]|nr:hypothetical protein [Alphaproteobacteria bacterium]